MVQNKHFAQTNSSDHKKLTTNQVGNIPSSNWQYGNLGVHRINTIVALQDVEIQDYSVVFWLASGALEISAIKLPIGRYREHWRERV